MGLGVLFYPMITQFYSTKQQDFVVRRFFDDISTIDEEFIIPEIIDRISEYNSVLKQNKLNGADNDKVHDEYISLLSMNYDKLLAAEALDNENLSEDKININTDLVGVVDVPKINAKLPIYKTAEDKYLQKGAGHIIGTSIPVGGKGTHTGISAHRGLPNAVMFRDLDQLEPGDEFYIYVLNKKLKYKVDEISTVFPADINKLKIEDDKDYATLVTCTPYAVNTYRLLVRGVRVEE